MDTADQAAVMNIMRHSHQPKCPIDICIHDPKQKREESQAIAVG